MHWLAMKSLDQFCPSCRFDDEKDAIQLANATEYGLVAVGGQLMELVGRG